MEHNSLLNNGGNYMWYLINQNGERCKAVETEKEARKELKTIANMLVMFILTIFLLCNSQIRKRGKQHEKDGNVFYMGNNKKR